MLEKTLESPLDGKEIKPVSAKGNQSWIFIGRTDAEAPILLPPGVKSRLIGKEPDVGTIEGERKRGRQDAMVGWHHWLNGQEQTLGDGEGQGSLACCSPWGCKESDRTAQLKNDMIVYIAYLPVWSILPSSHLLLPWFLGLFLYGNLRNGQMKPQSMLRSRIVKKPHRDFVVYCQPFLRGP